MRPLVSLAVPLLVLGLFNSPAAAQPSPAPSASAGAAPAPPPADSAAAVAQPPSAAPPGGAGDARAQARALYEVATAEYARGNYGLALEKIDAAIALLDAPTLLLARAQILDRLGRAQDARQAYVAYLRRRPDDPEGAAIRARVEELRGGGAAAGGVETSAAAAQASQAAAGASGGPTQPPGGQGPAPAAPKEVPRYRGGGLTLRVGGAVGFYNGTGEDGDGNPADYDGTLYGVVASAGFAFTPGLALTVGGFAGMTSLEETSEGGEPKDESGLAFIPMAELSWFPWPDGGLHLVAGGGYTALGDDEADEINEPVVTAGIGGAFFTSDDASVDIIGRLTMVPSDDGDAQVAGLSVEAAWLLW